MSYQEPFLRTRRLLNSIRGGNMGGNEYRVLNVPRFRVATDVAQNIPNATYPPATSITWTLNLLDTDGFWNAALPTRVTIKSPGVYSVKFQLEWTAAAGGTNRQAWIQLNLVNGIRYGHSLVYTAAAAIAFVNAGSADMTLNKGDTLELVAFQDTGAGATLAPIAGLYYGAELSGTLVSTL